MKKLNFREITYKSQDWSNAVQIREKILREPLGLKFTNFK
jgi:hypothetical protein